MPDSWKFEQERFILCEGEHDKVILESLIRGRNLGDFDVRFTGELNREGKGGKDAFGATIEGFPPIIGFNRLKGIAIVTDNDEEGTLDKTVKHLKKHGYSPKRDPQFGTIHEKPMFIILLPHIDTIGKLESLCLPALCDKWPGSSVCVEDYLKCTGATQWRKQKELDKARIRALVAGYNEKDPSKGFHHIFKSDNSLIFHNCFDNLANMLERFDKILEASEIGVY